MWIHKNIKPIKLFLDWFKKMQMFDNNDCIGKRIVSNDQFGIVKYVGVIEGTGNG